MSFYRKRAVVVEARQFTAGMGPEQAEWCGGTFWLIAPFGSRHRPVIEVPTPEGVKNAEVGDWIIKGATGEFDLCRPDIFEATYEPAPGGHADPHFMRHPLTDDDWCQCPCRECCGHAEGLEGLDCLCEKCGCHKEGNGLEKTELGGTS